MYEDIPFYYFCDGRYILKTSVGLIDQLKSFTLTLNEIENEYYKNSEEVVKKFYEYEGKFIQIEGDKDESGILTQVLIGEEDITKLEDVKSKIVVPIVNEPKPYS